MNKVGGGDGIPVEQFQILKDDAAPTSGEICMQVKKQQSELDMDQQTGSKQEKEYVKAVLYCHFASLTYMQNTS